MVKLIFNPKKNENENGVVSLVSKKAEKTEKVEKDLNPFKSTNLNEFVNENVKEFVNVNLIPQTTKDIIGLENCAYVLKEWYYKSKKPLLIIGPVGCGKTTLVELFCKEENIKVYTIKSSDTIKTKKELLKDISLFLEYNLTFFKKKENKLIFIDEYQNGQSDLLNLTDIANLTINNSTKLLIISSDAKGSKLSELKKTSEVYYINEINLYYITEWVKKLNIGTCDKTEIIIKNCKSDKRLLLNTLAFFNKTNEVFYKDSDVNLFEILFKIENNINELYKIYKTDGFILSNLIQENYLDYINDIHSIANAADAISYGEILFSDTYESSKSFLPDAHFINAICIPSYYAESDKSNKNIRTSCINNRYNIFLNNAKIIKTIDKDILEILFIKKFLNYNLIKTKILTISQEDFLKNLKFTFGMEKLELIYKHFSEFKETIVKETKTKNFTLKFKEKLNKLI
jgi:DNA polymerase III delta prime subunit